MQKVKILECGPRDGWQNLKQVLPTEEKLKYIDGLFACGLESVEITSFVSPKAIPQMVDAGEVARYCVEKYPDKELVALVPNFKGAELAKAAGLKNLTYVISVSESHNKANINRTHDQSFEELRRIRESFPELELCIGMATTFGCPFEGIPTLDKVLRFVERILPAYYEDFLRRRYPDIYFDLPAAFQNVDQATDFPAMSKLLFEVANYRGTGEAADLFYEAKVTEAIALVVDAWKRQSQSQSQARPMLAEDVESLQNVVSYIADHYAFDIPLERLANIACMSASKLKSCFKRQFGCSVTQYIQGRRMSQAEHLLIDMDFTMGQIAQMIGYTNSSRFAELFKKSTDILPIEYRRIARKDRV